MYWGRVIRVLLCTVLLTGLWCESTIAAVTDSCPFGESHEFESKILVPNNEKSEGEVENFCIHCGWSYIEYLPATGHEFGEWQPVEKNEESGTAIERRVCLQCGRGEVRTVGFEREPEQSETETIWRPNKMDYALSVSIGGMWGYVALILWYNSLVLNWYKREYRKNMRNRSKQ